MLKMTIKCLIFLFFILHFDTHQITMDGITQLHQLWMNWMFMDNLPLINKYLNNSEEHSIFRNTPK